MGASRQAAIVLAVASLAGCNAILGLEPTTLATDAAGGSGSTVGPDGAPVNGDDGASGSALAEGGSASGTSSGEAGEPPPPPDANCGDACGPASLECDPACGAGLACEHLGTGGCLDPEWAEWPVPNSPGMSAVNAESYTANNDGTVTDDVTHLMWQQAVPSKTYQQADAIDYCQSLTLAGHSDWRLPAQIELLSIVDYTRSSPCINAAYFPNTPANAFWSSTPSNAPVGPLGPLGWGVTFIYGTSGTNTVAFPGSVRCVR